MSFIRIQADDERVTFCNGLVLHRLQCLPGFGDWINSIMEFGRSLHRMELDISSLACMLSLVMITRKYKTHDISAQSLFETQDIKYAKFI